MKSVNMVRFVVVGMVLAAVVGCRPLEGTPDEDLNVNVTVTVNVDGGTTVAPDAGCPMGQTACGGVCVNAQTDNANCGACGHVCGASERCNSGACVAFDAGTTEVVFSCGAGQTNCSGICHDLVSDNANCGACGHVCGASERCNSGACVFSCGAGQTNCSGICHDLVSDNANCGACGNRCPAGQVCSSGSCTSTCGSTQVNCGGSCINLQSDNANCGACGNHCFAGLTCTAGSCGCLAGQTNCSGVCINLQSDNANCGACGRTCAIGTTCSSGVCLSAPCGSGLTNCGGSCRSLATDNANCGVCGNVCAAGTVCSAGSCTSTCGSGLTNCGGSCTTMQSDNANCGACGRTCAIGTTCSSGVCLSAPCGSGLTNCGGSCRSLATDNANCGVCGNVCAAGTVCSAGSCTSTCGSGLMNCSGVCRNLQGDTANCGACGNVCPSGQSCSLGVCRLPCPTGQTLCGTSCVNTISDRNNCGGCAIACGGGQTCEVGVCTTIASGVCFTAMRTLAANLSRSYIDSRYSTENSGRSCLDWQLRTWEVAFATATTARRIDGGIIGPMGTQLVMSAPVNGCMERVIVPTCLRDRPTSSAVNPTTGEPLVATDSRVVEIGVINMIDAACGVPSLSNGVNSITVDGEARSNSRFWAVPWSYPSGSHHLIVPIETSLPARCSPTPCPTGQTSCSGVCRDTATDVSNCGACGNTCATGTVCRVGACVAP